MKKLYSFRVSKYFYDLIHKMKEEKNITITDLILDSLKNEKIIEIKVDKDEFKKVMIQIDKVNPLVNKVAKKLNEVEKNLRDSVYSQQEALDFIEHVFDDEFLNEIEVMSDGLSEIINLLVQDDKLNYKYIENEITLNNILECKNEVKGEITNETKLEKL